MISSKVKLTTLALVLYAAGTLSAQGQNITNRFFFAYDYDNALTIDNTAGGVGFTASKVTPVGQAYRAQAVFVTVSCASSAPCDINYTYDGATTVTTTVGQTLSTGMSFTLFGYQNIVNFKAIRTGSNSAVLKVVYTR